MFTYLKQIWNSKDLRKKILFTILIIILYRFIAHITVPGANIEALKSVTERNQLLEMFSLLTGGSTENFSIVLMGISPYINASIIMQLLTVIIPKKHYENIYDIPENILQRIVVVAKNLAKAYVSALNAKGVNVLHASGKEAQQSVFHFHIHLVPRHPNDGLNLWYKSQPRIKANFDKIQTKIRKK